MLVFQLTLQGWQPNNTTENSEACIKWVKCSNRQVLDLWLNQTGIAELVENIDDNPQNECEFGEGLDVIIQDDLSEIWYHVYRDNPIDEWRQTCAACN